MILGNDSHYDVTLLMMVVDDNDNDCLWLFWVIVMIDNVVNQR